MTEERKATVLENIVRFASSHVYRQFLRVFTALITPKLLTPDHFGLWNLLKIII